MKRDFQADIDLLYEQEKARWQAEHPDATPQEYEQAIREIAERLNY